MHTASKIDLYIGHLPSDAHTSIDSAQFIRLGYISLSDNEQTGYRVGTGRVVGPVHSEEVGQC